MEWKLGYSPGEIALFTAIIFFIAFMFWIFVAENLHKDDFKRWFCEWLNGKIVYIYDKANYPNWICLTDKEIIYKF